jgi:hypothetical protein
VPPQSILLKLWCCGFLSLVLLPSWITMPMTVSSVLCMHRSVLILPI